MTVRNTTFFMDPDIGIYRLGNTFLSYRIIRVTNTQTSEYSIEIQIFYIQNTLARIITHCNKYTRASPILK